MIKFAMFMDAFEDIEPSIDTSLAMLAEACERGWSCVYFTIEDLFAEDGEVFAKVTEIIVNKTITKWEEKSSKIQNLRELDMILIRKDPPFNLEYLYATQLLELVERQGVLVTNKPRALRDNNEKLGILKYPDIFAPTVVASDKSILQTFWKTQQSVIFKPLNALGGASVFHVAEDGRNLGVILECLTNQECTPIMAQRYIPDVKTTGDKRIILINGEAMPFAFARFAKEGESRANLAAGGHGKVVPLTARDQELADILKPHLQAEELYFVGIDVIGDYVTEINVTSPTCVRQIMAETGVDIIGQYLDVLKEKHRGLGEE